MSINKLKYIENFLKIRDKKGKIVPLKLNSSQLKLYEIRKECFLKQIPCRVIILKARQLGFSTVTEALIFSDTTTNSNMRSGIIAHKEDSTTNLFNMSKLFYEYLPEPLKPAKKASNAQELIFDNDKGTGLKSKIRCMTAGSSGIGRSDTFNDLHMSEFAFWPGSKEDSLLGLLQAVPDEPNTMIVIESTANGFDYFQQLWTKAVNGENDWIPLFVGWNELPEYISPYKGFDLTEEEIKLKEQYNLTLTQLQWRRNTIANKCGGDINKFKQEYPICAEEAFIATGNCIFNKDNIIDRLKVINEPLKTGYFKYDYDGIDITNIQWIDDKNGYIKIWNEPIKDQYYVIGGDTAGDGSDWFIGDVINNQNGVQDCLLRHMFDETLYTHQMYCLGMYYNKALIGIETNFSTYPNKELQRLKYPNLYVRQTEDNYTHKTEERFGFRTTRNTRPLIINYVVDLIRDDVDKINDDVTLREALTFVKDQTGKPQAIDGAHDDTIIALGIAHYIRSQQKIYIVTNNSTKPSFKWPKDLLEDYYKADKATRERMIEKYGQPKTN